MSALFIYFNGAWSDNEFYVRSGLLDNCLFYFQGNVLEVRHNLCAECEDEFKGDPSFCVCCGKNLKTRVESSQNNIDFLNIYDRIAKLDSLVDLKKYSKQKNSLKEELVSFLQQLVPAKTLNSASPEDLRMFIVFKEKNGRTKIHSKTCEYRGIAGRSTCQCPVTMAVKSVDSLIGKIRAIFRDYGRSGEWNPMLGSGNPAAAPLIKKHLQCVEVEQTSAEIVNKQAVPFMFDKLARLCRHLNYKCYVERDPVSKFLYARDCSYFSILSHTGGRGGDMAILTASRIFELPQKQGIVISQIAGKTVKLDSPNNIVILPSKDPDICPVKHLSRYLCTASEMGLDLSQGYLFRIRDVKSKAILDKPVNSSLMTERLRTHLQAIKLYAGETTHSGRRGLAITLRMLGMTDTSINSHIGWGSSGMINHYANVGGLVGPNGVAQTLASAAEIKNSTSKLFQVSQVTTPLSLLKRFHFEKS